MIDREKWMGDLAGALHQWCNENGYHPFSRLAKELNVPIRVWRSILNGEAVSSQTEYYARIYKKTGLEEANPTTVPPRMRGKRFGTSSIQERAWTPKRLSEWLTQQETVTTQPEKPPSITTLRVSRTMKPKKVSSQKKEAGTLGQFLGAALGEFVDDLVNKAGDQLGSRITQRVAGEISTLLGSSSQKSQNMPDKGRMETSVLLGELHTRLKEAILGDDEELKRMVRDNAKLLGQIVPDVYALTRPLPESSRAIDIRRQVYREEEKLR